MKAIKNMIMTVIIAAAILLIPAVGKAAVTDNAIDYSGIKLNFIKADGSGFGMFSPSPEGGTTIALDGDNVVIHYVPKTTTVYTGIHWGLITDTLTRDLELVNGAFDITLPKSVCGKGLPIAPLKSDGKTSKEQYYLAIPPERFFLKQELAITNKLNMFKVVSAYVEKDSSGTYLLVSLSSTGYQNLFVGTYEEASANGDKHDNWVKYMENDEGKYTFEIKVDDKTYIPVVAISQSYLTKYEAKENPLERAFYPRQITFDPVAKSIVTDDFHNTVDLKISNNENLLKPSNAALTTVGGPNSNGYTVSLDLTMANDDYDAIFIGDKGKAAQAPAADIISLSADKVFKDIVVEKIITPGNVESIETVLEKATPISFRSKKDGSWMEVTTTVSKKNSSIDFKTTAPAPQGPAIGSQATVGGNVYKVTSATTAAFVKPSKKTLTKAVVPATVTVKGKSLKVTSINAYAFKSNKKLKAFIIGKNVKSIGTGAFMGCVKVKSITIPASVNTIGPKAFYGCKKAKKLIIKGTAIKSFGKKAFGKTGIKKFKAPKKVRKAYRKKVIKAGMKKSVK